MACRDDYKIKSHPSANKRKETRHCDSDVSRTGDLLVTPTYTAPAPGLRPPYSGNYVHLAGVRLAFIKIQTEYFS